MALVVEAFRFLSARVHTLEERLAREDRPIEGAAWLIPARELGEWVQPVVDHIVAAAPAGEVLHADCGEGQLLGSLRRAGVAGPRRRAPRGRGPAGPRAGLCGLDRRGGRRSGGPAVGVAGRPRPERRGRPPPPARRSSWSSPRPIVCWRSVRRSWWWRPSPRTARAERDVVADEVLDPRTLHARTWEVLLARAGFAGAAPMAAARPGTAGWPSPPQCRSDRIAFCPVSSQIY